MFPFQVRDAMAALGNKLPAEIDLALQASLTQTSTEHVETEDSKVRSIFISYIASSYLYICIYVCMYIYIYIYIYEVVPRDRKLQGAPLLYLDLYPR